MPIIAGHAEADPDDRDEAVAVMRDLLTRACDAPECLDVAITVDSVDPTGAVLTGRRTAEQVDHWNGDYLGAPIFVPSHRLPRSTVAGYPRVTYVPDGIESAMARAEAKAAGDRDVPLRGAYTAQRVLEAGGLDELLISHVLVPFGAGRRLFGVLTSRIELEVVRVIDTPEATHIRYRIRRRTDERTT
jgi:dihydrofolate reductase